MVLAANCCRARKLRYLVDLPLTGKANEIMVPLIPFGVPSEETFLLFLRILYLKDYRSTFFPFMDKGSVPLTPDENASPYLVQRLERASECVLKECLKRTHGLWLNACALGLIDNLFWQWLNFAWGTYRDALGAKYRQPRTT